VRRSNDESILEMKMENTTNRNEIERR